MTTTIADVGWVDVRGTLEPSAIAGHIAAEAHNRVAEALTHAVDGLEDDGRGLTQLQRAQLLESVLRHMDGFERATLDTIMSAISRAAERGDDVR